MLTPITDHTPTSLQLGAGVFLLGLPIDAAPDAATLRAQIADALADESRTLGLTTGGGWFRCTPALRSPESAAGRTPSVGGVLVDGWTVTLTGTLLEVTPARLARLLPGCAVRRSARLTVLTPRAALAAEHLPPLCWVGDTAAGLVAIELTGALNTAGAALRIVERGAGTLPFEFRAHRVGPREEEAPCRLIFLD